MPRNSRILKVIGKVQHIQFLICWWFWQLLVIFRLEDQVACRAGKGPFTCTYSQTVLSEDYYESDSTKFTYKKANRQPDF